MDVCWGLTSVCIIGAQLENILQDQRSKQSSIPSRKPSELVHFLVLKFSLHFPFQTGKSPASHPLGATKILKSWNINFRGTLTLEVTSLIFDFNRQLEFQPSIRFARSLKFRLRLRQFKENTEPKPRPQEFRYKFR